MGKKISEHPEHTSQVAGTDYILMNVGGVTKRVRPSFLAAALGLPIPDTTPPGISSITAIDAHHIQVVFNESTTPTIAGWSFKDGATALTVTGVTGSGTTWQFTITETMTDASVLTASYNSATGNTVDGSSNELISFTDAAVVNNIVILPTGAILIFSDGQSNDVGRAAADAPNEVTAPAGCYEYLPATDSLRALADPTGTGDALATDRSLQVNLAKRIKELTGQDVIIVKVGKGNTPIETFINTGSALYTAALASWNGLVDFCTANAITVSAKYGHFLQGENNAGLLETDAYLENLNTYIDQRITTFGLDKVFVTRIGYDPSFASSVDSEKIMLAQNLLDLSKDEMLLTTKAASTFTTGNGKMKSDGVHYTVTGLNEIGDDVADAIYQLQTNNKKVAHTTEPVTSLQDPGGYFDDIYNFRSLTPGDNADFTELYGRNNLTLSSGSPTFDAKNGLNVLGSIVLAPATTRLLANSHDWSIEATMKINGTVDTMFLTGVAPNFDSNWIWFSGTNLNITGTGGGKIVSLAGKNLNQLFNLAITYVSATNTLRVYFNGELVHTSTDATFTSLNYTRYFFGYTAGGSLPFIGTIERLRIVKRALATWEFDRSPNIGIVPVFDYDFQFNSSIAEAEGDISTAYYLFNGTSGSPSYDADGIVLPEGPYVRLGTQKSCQNATVEYRLKHDASLADGLEFITGPTPSPSTSGGGFERMISHDIPGNAIRFGTELSVALWSGLSVTWTSFNTFKFVRNYAGNTIELFINGVSQGSKSLTGEFLINIIGAGHPTQAYSFKGTIDWFKIKNFV